ncbi:MAG: hypothetical protein HY819_02175 [Acidobacteria bacterium]|nr:hypothetical protein [Acidobacteriota bacterium]
MKKLICMLLILLVFLVGSENKTEGKRKPVLQSQNNTKIASNKTIEDKKDLIKLRLIGRKAKLSRDKEESIVDLKKQINAEGNHKYKIIDRREKDGKHYFLFVVRGSTRAKLGGGYCGAGSECNLVWMKIDNSLKVESIKSILTESCVEDIEGGSDLDGFTDYKVAKGKFSFTFIKLESKDNEVYIREKELLYILSKPENGIKIIKESFYPANTD